MKWGGAGAGSYLEVDVKLNLTLEVCLILIKYINIAYTRRVVILYAMIIKFVFEDYEIMNCFTSCKLYCSLIRKKVQVFC